MKQSRLLPVVTVAIGATLAVIGSQAMMAQSSPVTRTILQQKDLEGVAGREVVMYRADIVPGGVIGKHIHPGPELLYVLEGTLILEPHGQPPLTLKAGDSAHMPAKHVHNARNPSTAEHAKLVVVLVGEKGQPLATMVE